jgi:hypothetical protein
VRGLVPASCRPLPTPTPLPNPNPNPPTSSGDLTNHVDATDLRLRGARKRVAEVIKAAQSDRQLHIIITLTVVLVILVVTAIM